MPIILQNDTASTLRVGVAAGDTTLIVASGQGSRFPTLGVGDYFYATLEDTAGDKEIVQITARSGDSLTAVRGAESTAAREFPAGSTIEMRVTAASVVDAAANAVSLSALGVTASAAELNVLDGITASTAELNRMDGVTWTLTDYNTLTASVAELNLLDGVTWTLTDYNTLTATAAELNALDGITASTAELNLLDGVTWTLTDYNTLTATAAELNALDGVTTAGTNIVRAADAAAQRTVLGLDTLVVPAGAVFWFAADSPPTGYLECDGSNVSRTTYAALFAVIGTTFGVGDGSTTFTLPDLRGEFVRGWDNGRGVDSGRAFGSAQADDFEAHVHEVRSSQASADIGSTTRTGSVGTGAANETQIGSTQSTGGTETRPRNIALLPCIKV